MGLLKSLFGEAAEKALSQVKDAITAAMAEQEKMAASRPAMTETPRPEPVYVERTASEWRAFFREIIQTECVGYTFRENVPVTEIAGQVSDEFKLYRTRPTQVYKAEWGEPYTFVLYQGTDPKAVVMLGDGHSHDAKVKFLIARMYAKKAGLPYINFYTQIPNERDYVVGRIRKFLS